MLHIATVHFGSPRWIEIQTSHLRKHLPVPFQTWTSLEEIDASYGSHFDVVVDQKGRHSDKLNHLAIEIAAVAQDDDLLMFLDGDAFPIADPMALIDDGLSRAPLLAVRRAENVGDRQPHPCFCVTTVGAWRRLPGDWSAGYRWEDSMGRRVTDVGGNLLRQLELTGTPWVEVLRSNTTNLDPIFFGVYGDVIYHHGAGFRGSEFTRAHSALKPPAASGSALPLVGRLRRRGELRRQREWAEDTRRKQLSDSERLFEQIEQGDSAWLSALLAGA
jgi:hypothetical protein